MPTPDNKIWITVVRNPFDPHRSKEQDWIDHTPGMTAFDCIKAFYPLVSDDFDVEMSVNGKLLPATDDLKHLPIKIGSNVVFCAVPHGGDNGAKMLRTVAMIAVMVVATYVSGGTAAFGVAGGSTGYGAIAGAAVAIGGSMLVNAVLPAPTPDVQDIEAIEQNSPTYSWGAEPNTYLEGSRWPVLYGSRRITPPILAKHITESASDTSDEMQQYIHILMAVADHAVDSITDIEINGSPIANFEGASYETKLGALDQTVISDFYWQRQQTSVGQEISYESEYTGQTTGDAVTGIEIGLLLPGGLYYVDDDGNLKSVYYKWRLSYRVTGAPTWTTWKTISLNKNTRKTLRAYAIKTGLAPNQYDVKVEALTQFSGTRTTTHTHEVFTPLPFSYYDNNGTVPDPITRTVTETVTIDEKRYSPSESYVEYVGEIIEEDFTYPGASLLAVKAIATGQLSGSRPTITCVATRSTVETNDGNKTANLPAWQAYDMQCNSEYGENISESAMTLSDFTTWASFCTTNGLISNLYIDSKMSLMDALSNAEQIGRGRVVERGTKYGVIIDQADDPVQLFGIGNIGVDSFEMGYIDSADQANIVQVSFFDEDNDYIKRIAQVVVPGFDPTTDETNIAAITLYGCTDGDIALKHAKYLLNCNTLQIRTVTFEAGFDALACQAGDVIRVAYDAINWGQSGRVVSSTALSTTVDRNVTLLTGTTYYAVVQHQDDDDIEQVELTAVGVDTTSATFAIEAPGWTATPAADAVISIGTSTTLTKSFRVTKITRASDQKRKVWALEYNANVYNDTVTAEPYVAPDTYDIVSGLAAREVSEILDGRYKISVNLSWRGVAYKWRVYYRKNGDSAWIYLGDTIRPEYSVQNLMAGESYDFAVTDMWQGPDYYATIEGLSIVGWSDTSLPIYKVTGLEITEDGNGSIWYGRDLKLSWNTAAEFWPDEADGDPGGANTFSPAESALVYRVLIANTDHVMLRQVIIKESEYVYTYEHNYQDTNGSPESSLIVAIWARNASGMESSIPATLYVTNPAPSAVTGLDSLAYMGGVKAYWNASTDPDIAGYQVRYQIDESGQTMSWTGVDWIDVDGTEFVAPLTNAQRIADTDTAYFQVRAKDTFGNYSTIVEDEATADDFFVVEGELSSDLQTKITDAAEMTSQVTLMDDSWTVKIQENDYIAGMGLMVYDQWDSTTTYSIDDYCYNSGVVYIATAGSTNQEPPNASYWDVVPYGAKSEAIFLVDKFAIINPSGGDGVKRAPFIVGNVGGTATVGINGALTVDGTITAAAVATNTLTANEINGGSFGTLELTASNGITLKDGSDLLLETGSTLTLQSELIVEGSIKYYDADTYWYDSSDTLSFEMGTGAGPLWYLWPRAGSFSNATTGELKFGDDSNERTYEKITMSAGQFIFKKYLYGTATYGTAEFGLDILPLTDDKFDLGSGTKHWDNIYSQNVLTVSDFYWMDERIKNGCILPIDDISLIKSILPSNKIDATTGLRLINDSTLPKWMVHKHKDSGQVKNDDGDRIQTWKAGEVAVDSKGRPYMSTTMMLSLLMGAVRQLDDKIEAMKND